MRATAILSLAILMLTVAPAYALRCGAKLVSEGDPQLLVRVRCGEPDAIEQRVIYRTLHLSRHRHGEKIVEPITVEEWIYNFGPRRLMRQLWFEDGKLIRIRSLGYGYVGR